MMRIAVGLSVAAQFIRSGLTADIDTPQWVYSDSAANIATCGMGTDAGTNAARCGQNIWSKAGASGVPPTAYAACSGTMQSPIDLNQAAPTAYPTPLSLTLNRVTTNTCGNAEFQVNQHTVKVVTSASCPQSYKATWNSK